jgi:hypothetical protein
VHHVQPEVWDDAASLLVLALHHGDLELLQHLLTRLASGESHGFPKTSDA